MRTVRGLQTRRQMENPLERMRRTARFPGVRRQTAQQPTGRLRGHVTLTTTLMAVSEESRSLKRHFPAIPNAFKT